MERLAVDRPAFHGHGRMRWDVSVGTLDAIRRLVRPSDRTLEVGVGASTAVFAASSRSHTAVGIAREEYERLVGYCSTIGLDLGNVEFLQGPSDRVLPTVTGPFDVVLLDGAHGFPFPIVDFHHASRVLAVGGFLVLDDLPIPSVQILHRYLRTDPSWSLAEVADDRAAVFQLVAAMPGGDPWQEQPFNRGYPDYSFLPALRRVRVRLTSRLRRSRVVRAALKVQD
ncbi:MAG TPA: class I SAM-dependent methyltransferase [Marmoricola sp.]